MKKFFLLSVMLLSALSAAAQVYLSRNYEPIEKREFKYNPCYPGVKNYDDVMGISAFRYTNGFTLRNGVLNSDAEEWAYAVFSLKGQYEKLSFVVGLSKGWSAYGGIRFSPDDDGTHIVTVRANGRRIFDEVIRDWAPPREVVLDISGVDELRFDHLKGLYTIAFGEVKLWKKGQTPTPAPNPLADVVNKDKVNLVDDIQPHFLCHRGWNTSAFRTALFNAEAGINGDQLLSGDGEILGVAHIAAVALQVCLDGAPEFEPHDVPELAAPHPVGKLHHHLVRTKVALHERSLCFFNQLRPRFRTKYFNYVHIAACFIRSQIYKLLTACTIHEHKNGPICLFRI